MKTEIQDGVNSIIISGFPGTGKSYMCNEESSFSFIDSDSSDFSWIKDKNGNNTVDRNPNFINDYIDHIKENIGRVNIIFISSHDIVRKALEDNDIEYVLVYPRRYLRDEYIRRYKERGSSEIFINMIYNNWDKFIDEIEGEEFPHKVCLNNNEYIKDIVKEGICLYDTKEYMVSNHNTLDCPIYCDGCNHNNKFIIKREKRK